MQCIAHRGFAGANPENTLPAVRAAVEAGADVIEVDARRCGTGEIVVCHDDTLGRLTDAGGAVAESSLSTLRELDVLDSGAGIPTLADVFAAVPADVGINVELKERGLAADCLAVADRHDNGVLVSSFDADTLQEVDAVSDCPLALLFASDPSTALDLARDLDCDAVHPYRQLCDVAVVDTAHDTGFAVNAWTIQSTEHAERLAALGVDGLIADDPRFCRD